MRKATLKGLMAHKFRLAATALAIVLGVSFVSGTYVLTDTITASFDSLFKQVTQGIDVAVRSEETFGGFDTGEVRDPMPASLLERIQAVDGVRVAEGNVTGYAQLVGKDGKAVTTSGAPSLGVSFNQDPQFSAGSTVRSGRLPSGPSEMAIDAKTAEDTGYVVGDRAKVLFQGPARDFTVSGIIGFGEADNLGGARLVGFDLATAQEVMNRQGRFDEIDVAAEAGVTPEQLRDRIRAAVDPRYEVLTGERAGRGHGRRHQRHHRAVPGHGPARLRLRGPAGGGVPDLQHLHHHRRPAHPRAGPAPLPGGQPPPGDELGAARVADRRDRRLPGRPRPRGADRRRPARPAEHLPRGRHPRHRHPVPAPHHHRVAGRRHRGHRAGGAAAGPEGDPGAAGGRPPAGDGVRPDRLPQAPDRPRRAGHRHRGGPAAGRPVPERGQPAGQRRLGCGGGVLRRGHPEPADRPARWPGSSAGRSPAPSGCPGPWPARTPCATRGGPPRPRPP